MTKFTVELTDETIDYLVQAIRIQAESVIQQLTKPRYDNAMNGLDELLQKLADDYDSNQDKVESNWQQESKTAAGEKMMKPFSPYGLKKDGTPAKRRGRPSTKKAKKVAA